MASDIPDKLFFRIGEVSRIAGVPSSVLRFWESQFPRIRPKRTDAGQRLYRPSDVQLILSIKHLLYERKFTIKGARRYLQSATGRGDAPWSESQTGPSAAHQTFLQEVRAELKAIRDLLEGL